jgi:GDPmannose 4,6-dehydratase
MSDSHSIQSLIKTTQPNEVYNLAAQSHVGISFTIPHYTASIDALATISILESIREINPEIRLYQASSSEMFGDSKGVVLCETSEMNPRSPYGAAKVFAYNLAKIYRTSYDLFSSNGILFNHESPRRADNFVTKKIVNGAVRFSKDGTPLVLGNLDSKRDWGHAKDYCAGMILINNFDYPDDWVLATGIQYSVRNFVEITFGLLGISITWSGVGEQEVGLDSKSGKVAIKVSDLYMRPWDVTDLIGDSSKAKRLLGWTQSYTFENLIDEMVSHSLSAYDRGFL